MNFINNSLKRSEFFISLFIAYHYSFPPILEEQFISWTDVLEIQLTDQYFQFWEDILHLENEHS